MEYKNLAEAIAEAKANGHSKDISTEFAVAFVTLYKGSLDDGEFQLWREITDCGCDDSKADHNGGDDENFCTTTVTDDDIEGAEKDGETIAEYLTGWEHLHIELNEHPAPVVLVVLDTGIVEAVEVRGESVAFECAHLDILKDMDNGDAWDELSASMRALIRRDYPEVAAEAEQQSKANSKHRYGV